MDYRGLDVVVKSIENCSGNECGSVAAAARITGTSRIHTRVAAHRALAIVAAVHLVIVHKNTQGSHEAKKLHNR